MCDRREKQKNEENAPRPHTPCAYFASLLPSFSSFLFLPFLYCSCSFLFASLPHILLYLFPILFLLLILLVFLLSSFSITSLLSLPFSFHFLLCIFSNIIMQKVHKVEEGRERGFSLFERTLRREAEFA